MAWNAGKTIETFAIARYSFCSIPYQTALPTSQLPWIHSPYRDALSLAFTYPALYPSDSATVQILWRSQLLENIDLSTILKYPVDSPFVVVASSPRIALKFVVVEVDGTMTSRRIQIRFEDDRTYTSCLGLFERHGCLIKRISTSVNIVSDSQLSFSQSEPHSSQHSHPLQSLSQPAFSPMMSRTNGLIMNSLTSRSTTSYSAPKTPTQFFSQPVTATPDEKIQETQSLPSPLTTQIGQEKGTMSDSEVSKYIRDCLCNPRFVQLCEQVDRIFAAL